MEGIESIKEGLEANFNGEIVRVHWLDSARPRPDWEFTQDISGLKVIDCYTVGWIIRDAERFIAVAQNYGELYGPDSDHQVSGIITIPKPAIIEINRLGV